jgi:predicted dehydrogenase
VGVLGLGFMGATHIAAYSAAREAGFACELVAVCDRKASRRRGELWDVGGNAVSDTSAHTLAFDPSRVKAYERADQLIDDPNVDLVSVCTRTDTHVDIATRCLRAGKHVLLEKPVSLRSHEIRKLAQIARESNKLCMPAMCIRFWPQWQWLKQRIDDRSFGRCISATFHRLASMPRWNPFFARGDVSGGALVDLHIHDADFVRWCFGDPQSLSSAGYFGASGAVDHVTTQYHYANGPSHVVAEGGWDHHDGFGFRMRYVAIFEQATADYDLTRDPPLLLCRDGKAEKVELPAINGYDGEVRHLISAILENRSNDQLTAMLDDAAAVADLLDAERRSIEARHPVQLAGS